MNNTDEKRSKSNISYYLIRAVIILIILMIVCDRIMIICDQICYLYEWSVIPLSLLVVVSVLIGFYYITSPYEHRR